MSNSKRRGAKPGAIKERTGTKQMKEVWKDDGPHIKRLVSWVLGRAGHGRDRGGSWTLFPPSVVHGGCLG